MRNDLRSGAFEDEDVIHVDGEVNPVRDLETIGEELRLKDEEQLLQHIEKLDRQVNRGNDKKLKPEYVCTYSPTSLLHLIKLCPWHCTGSS